MPIAFAWLLAFAIGAAIILAIGALSVWIYEEPDSAPYVIAFIIGSVLVGWLLANWFGWWDAWVYG